MGWTMMIDDAIEQYLQASGISLLIIFVLLVIVISVSLTEKKRKLRQEANLEILELIRNRIMACPDERFGQILRNIGVTIDVGVKDSAQEDWETPDYYWMRGVHEESTKTLERVKKSLANNYEDVTIVTRSKK